MVVMDSVSGDQARLAAAKEQGPAVEERGGAASGAAHDHDNQCAATLPSLP